MTPAEALLVELNRRFIDDCVSEIIKTLDCEGVSRPLRLLPTMGAKVDQCFDLLYEFCDLHGIDRESIPVPVER